MSYLFGITQASSYIVYIRPKDIPEIAPTAIPLDDHLLPPLYMYLRPNDIPEILPIAIVTYDHLSQLARTYSIAPISIGPDVHFSQNTSTYLHLPTLVE